jgi:hypothetical protein
MYLLLLVVGIGFMLYERMGLGWFFVLLGLVFWALLFGIEINMIENDRSVGN